MKELSIEEKAKAYDEAIKKAGERYNEEYTSTLERSTLAHVFPELKESEDERIRKELLNYLYDVHDDDEERARWIAWLEKQGKNNMGISEATKKKLEDNLNKALEKETPESLNKFLDRQGEQKPYGQREECFDCQFNYAGECKGSCAMKRGEQNPAWSEEDEENLNWFEKFFRAESVIAEGKDIPQDRYMWFKNLKDRVQPQPKQEWDEEDERRLNIICSLLEDIPSHQNWLRTLKDRVLMTKVTCDEKDKEKLESIINKASYNCCLKNDDISFLKDLKERYAWKPSDEQIVALEDAIADAVSSIHKNRLNSLYSDLKKLK